jgi:hypothetical protein
VGRRALAQGSSWLNQVETWFSILLGQSLNGTSFTAVEQLHEHFDALLTTDSRTWSLVAAEAQGSTAVRTQTNGTQRLAF